MFASLFPLLFIIVLECRGHNEKCVVYPKDPVISMGDDIQVMFKALDNSLCSNVPSYSPEKLFWMLNDEKINESLYIIINSTIPAVNIQNFTHQSGMVTCHMNVGGKNTILGGTKIKVNFPPVKPTNVSCVTVIFQNFTCYWDSGENTADTIYKVSRRTDDGFDTCQSERSPCSFIDKLSSTEVWVTAQSSQGIAVSDVRKYEEIYSTVKPDPPQKVKAERLFNSVDVELKVTWEKPNTTFFAYDLVYEVQYSYQQGDSSHKHVRNSTERELYIDVERECTLYTISVRCAIQEKWTPVWSDWSPHTTVISPLNVYSLNLLLWRRIHWPDGSGNRKVQLMWRGVPPSCDAIEGYRVTLNGKNNHTRVMPFNPINTSSFITVDKEAYTVRIVAYRHENIFSEDTTTIPAAGEDVLLLPVTAARVFSYNSQIHVCWKKPSESSSAYMVDWSAGDADYGWQETETTNIAFDDWEKVKRITDGEPIHLIFVGQPQKLYNITVTPIYNKSPGQETPLQAYVEEGVLGKFFSVNVTKVKTDGALVRWDECCSCTTNYTVFYKAAVGPEKSVAVGSHQAVPLDNLQSGTTYRVHVMDSSIAGGINSSHSFFTTHSYGPNFIDLLGIFGGLGIFLLFMIGLCCSIIKKQILKPVPNPRDTQAVSWPPQSGQRPLLMPVKETYSEELRIYIYNGGASPDNTENTQPVSPHTQLKPASDLGPCSIKGTEDPIGSLPYVLECPAPGEWDRGKNSASDSETSGESVPVSPYLKNCMPSVNGRVYPCSKRKPAPPSGQESRTVPEPQPQSLLASARAYVSINMFQEGLLQHV